MNAPAPQPRPPLTWPTSDNTRVPYAVYTDPQIYAREQERIFRGPTWNYVALEAEIPRAGDFVTTYIGDTPVVVTRAEDGAVHCWVNRCAHRGALVCRDKRGNAPTHTCVYHQWSYDHAGRLIGVPFRKGLGGKGGYPADFDMAAHGLRRLRVHAHRGLVFATFSDATVPFDEYMGESMMWNLDRVLDRPLKLLGYSHQYVNCNWKLYAENTRDSYHAMLLHLFYPTFGIARPAQRVEIRMNETRFHNLFTVWKPQGDESMDEFKQNARREFTGGPQALKNPELLHFMNERGDDIMITIESLFPNCVVQHIENGLAVRQIQPKAPDQFELVWTYFGYEDDPPELHEHRLKQANLLGPAGYIAMEDAEAGEIVQRSISDGSNDNAFVEMGGAGTEDLDYSGTDENSIRGFWTGYRELMGL